MSLRPISIVLAVAVAGAVSSQAAPAGGATWCKPPSGARTLLLSKEARVWRRRGRTYVCPNATGRAVHLGDEPESASQPTSLYVHSLRLNRRFLAFAFEVSREETDLQIRLFELRKGRFVRRIVADTQEAAPDPQAPEAVTDLALAQNGSLVWIVQNARVQPPRPEVSKFDRFGRALLDAGPGIELRSLAITNDRAYWTYAGVARSAALQDR